MRIRSRTGLQKSIFLRIILLMLLTTVQVETQAVKGQSTPEVNAQEPPEFWENLGLYGGEVIRVAYSKVPGEVYLGVSSKGFYKSTDHGFTWTKITAGGGLAIGIDQSSGRIYIDRYCISVSTDSGQTWTDHPEIDGQIRDIAVDPNNGLAAYVGTGNDDRLSYDGRVHRTLNGGDTWQTAAVNDNQCIVSVAVNPTNSDEIWAVGGQCAMPVTQSTLYQSTNQGETYTPALEVDIGEGDLKMVVIDDTGAIYVGGSAGLWVSSDGSTFTKVLVSPVTRININPHNGMIYVDEYQSDDGQNWNYNGLPFLFGIDPHKTNHFIAPSIQGIQITTDGGASWEEANTGIEGVSVVDVKSDPNHTDILYAASINGFAISNDNGATWDFPVKSGDQYPTGFSIAVDLANPDILYLGSENALVWRSEDGGQTWENNWITSSEAFVWDLAIDPNNPDMIYAAIAPFAGKTAESGLFYSTNQGEDWFETDLVGLRVNSVVAIDDVNGTTLYAGVGDRWYGTTQGGVYRRLAGQSEWEQVGPTNAVVQTIFVDPDQPQHLLIGVGPRMVNDLPPYGILESNDGGESWLQIFNTQSEFAVLSIAIDPQNPNILFAGAASMIYMSSNGGQSWSLFYEGEDAFYEVIYIPPPSNELRTARNTTTSTLYLGADTGLYRRVLSFNFLYLPMFVR